MPEYIKGLGIYHCTGYLFDAIVLSPSVEELAELLRRKIGNDDFEHKFLGICVVPCIASILIMQDGFYREE